MKKLLYVYVLLVLLLVGCSGRQASTESASKAREIAMAQQVAEAQSRTKEMQEQLTAQRQLLDQQKDRNRTITLTLSIAGVLALFFGVAMGSSSKKSSQNRSPIKHD